MKWNKEENIRVQLPLAFLRKSHDYTQEDLARRLDISRHGSLNMGNGD